MTAHGRSIDDRELDILLRAMLAEEPVSAPERIAQQALAQVATTPQRRPLVRAGARVGPVAAGPRARAWFAAAAVLVTLTIVAALVGSGPNPAPVPTPSPTPPEFTMFRSESDGYELLVPSTWQQTPSDYPDARVWSGPDGELMVSYGMSIFEGGNVTFCGPPAPTYLTCIPMEFGYSVPFDPEVDGVGPIDLDVQMERCDGCHAVKSDTTLDGEAARLSALALSGRQTTYVSTFHQRRPVIVYWSEPAGASKPGRIEAMRASFRFIDTPLPSPTPFADPTELVLYRNETDGYEILVPRFWGEGRTPTPALPGVHRFGFGGGFGTGGDAALTISIGEPDGSVVVCQNLAGCQTLRATTLDELAKALISVPVEMQTAPGAPRPRNGAFVLNGEAGGFERPEWSTSSHGCLGCAGFLYFQYVIHEGRPIVLAWDLWTVVLDRLAPAYVQQIVDSFRLLD